MSDPIPAPIPRIAEIQRAAAIEFGVSIADLVSDRRLREIVRPRQVAMYVARELTYQSTTSIGRWFGGRDHTTVMHAVKRVAADAERLFEAERVARRVAGIVAGRDGFDPDQLALAL